MSIGLRAGQAAVSGSRCAWVRSRALVCARRSSGPRLRKPLSSRTRSRRFLAKVRCWIDVEPQRTGIAIGRRSRLADARKKPPASPLRRGEAGGTQRSSERAASQRFGLTSRRRCARSLDATIAAAATASDENSCPGRGGLPPSRGLASSARIGVERNGETRGTQSRSDCSTADGAVTTPMSPATQRTTPTIAGPCRRASAGQPSTPEFRDRGRAWVLARTGDRLDARRLMLSVIDRRVAALDAAPQRHAQEPLLRGDDGGRHRATGDRSR